MNIQKKIDLVVFVAVLLVSFGTILTTSALQFTSIVDAAPGDVSPVFTDSLAPEWSISSFAAIVNLTNTQTQSGTHAISFTSDYPWAEMTVKRNTFLSTVPYTHLRFAAKGGDKFAVYLTNSLNQQFTGPILLSNYIQPSNTAWNVYSISLEDLKAVNSAISNIVFVDMSGSAQKTLYIDQIEFVHIDGTTLQPTGSNIPIRITAPSQNTISETASGTNFSASTYTNPSKGLKLYVNNVLKKTCIVTPCAYYWPTNTAGIAGQTHLLKVEVVDFYGTGIPAIATKVVAVGTLSTPTQPIITGPATTGQPTQAPQPSVTPTITSTLTPTQPTTVFQLYGDELPAGWENWTGAAANLNNTSPVFSGTKSIAYTAPAWGTMDFAIPSGFQTGSYTHLSFMAQGSIENQRFAVYLRDTAGNPLKAPTFINEFGDPLTTSWKMYSIPLEVLNGVNKTIGHVVFHEWSGTAQPVVYFDNIEFKKLTSPTTTIKVGDANNDGKVDVQDYNTLVTQFNQSGQNLSADFNKSGKVDVQDYNMLVSNFGK